jgi:hypothetical protein
MKWKNERTLQGWRPSRSVTVGEDLEGDIVFLGHDGDSIIISSKEAGNLIDWLRANYPEADRRC